MGTLEIADKYINRDGKPPQIDAGRSRIWLADVSDIVALARYLGWQDGEMFGGVKSEEAWLAFCRIVGKPAAEFRSIVRD